MDISNFLKKLYEVDNESVETRFIYSSDFKQKTGIHSVRMASIIKSEGEGATLEEMKKIVNYYRDKTGKEIKFEDIFPLK